MILAQTVVHLLYALLRAANPILRSPFDKIDTFALVLSAEKLERISTGDLISLFNPIQLGHYSTISVEPVEFASVESGRAEGSCSFLARPQSWDLPLFVSRVFIQNPSILWCWRDESIY